jgi:hypothetical protein
VTKAGWNFPLEISRESSASVAPQIMGSIACVEFPLLVTVFLESRYVVRATV